MSSGKYTPTVIIISFGLSSAVRFHMLKFIKLKISLLYNPSQNPFLSTISFSFILFSLLIKYKNIKDGTIGFDRIQFDKSQSYDKINYTLLISHMHNYVSNQLSSAYFSTKN